VHNTLKGRTLTTQFTGALGVFPNTGLGQFQIYFVETVLTLIEVKDTP
jgi:hypothetical protein